MCLITIQNDGHSFTDDELRGFWLRNQDGYGFMWADAEGLHTCRFLGTASDLVANYRSTIDGRAGVMHLRQRTHGPVDIANAHPHSVITRDDGPSEIAVVHNGIISGYGSAKDGKSDTVDFIECVIRPWLLEDPEAVFRSGAQALLEHAVGSFNRMVFMDAHGRMAVINGHMGVNHNGVWYSNEYAWDAPSAKAEDDVEYNMAYEEWLRRRREESDADASFKYDDTAGMYRHQGGYWDWDESSKKFVRVCSIPDYDELAGIQK